MFLRKLFRPKICVVCGVEQEAPTCNCGNSTDKLDRFSRTRPEAERLLCLGCNRQFDKRIDSFTHCPHDSTQLINLGRDETSEFFGWVVNDAYEISTRHARSRSSSIFLGTRLSDGMRVVLKSYDLRLMDSESLAGMIQSAKILASSEFEGKPRLLDHHICQRLGLAVTFGVLQKHMTESLPLLQDIRGDLPEAAALDVLIAKATAKKPTERFSSMEV